MIHAMGYMLVLKVNQFSEPFTCMLRYTRASSCTPTTSPIGDSSADGQADHATT